MTSCLVCYTCTCSFNLHDVSEHFDSYHDILCTNLGPQTLQDKEQAKQHPKSNLPLVCFRGGSPPIPDVSGIHLDDSCMVLVKHLRSLVFTKIRRFWLNYEINFECSQVIAVMFNILKYSVTCPKKRQFHALAKRQLIASYWIFSLKLASLFEW